MLLIVLDKRDILRGGQTALPGTRDLPCHLSMTEAPELRDV